MIESYTLDESWSKTETRWSCSDSSCMMIQNDSFWNRLSLILWLKEVNVFLINDQKSSSLVKITSFFSFWSDDDSIVRIWQAMIEDMSSLIVFRLKLNNDSEWLSSRSFELDFLIWEIQCFSHQWLRKLELSESYVDAEIISQ